MPPLPWLPALSRIPFYRRRGGQDETEAYLRNKPLSRRKGRTATPGSPFRRPVDESTPAAAVGAGPPRQTVFRSQTAAHTTAPSWDEDFVVDLGVAPRPYTVAGDFPVLRVEVRLWRGLIGALYRGLDGA